MNVTLRYCALQLISYNAKYVMSNQKMETVCGMWRNCFSSHRRQFLNAWLLYFLVLDWSRLKNLFADKIHVVTDKYIENSKRKLFPANKSENASKLLVGLPIPIRTPFFSWSFTLVPRFLLRNRTETLATHWGARRLCVDVLRQLTLDADH